MLILTLISSSSRGLIAPDAIISTTEQYDKDLKDLRATVSAGVDKKRWVADRLQEASVGVPVAEFGAHMFAVDHALKTANDQMRITITRLDNALENLAGSLQAEQNSLEETKAQLENARTELATPFAREEELAEKTARLKELNILLNMDEKDKTLMDDTPDEGEDVPARRVAELAR